MKLRPYQAEAVESTLEAFKTHRSALIVMPTGTGKTRVASEIIDRMPGRKMVIAHRIELIDQAKQNIERVTGFECDTERGQEYSRENELYGKARIVVATVQTLNSGRNRYRFERFDPMDFGLVWCDEFHHGTADTYGRVFEHFKQNPDCKILGVTATPDRADETALGLIAETVSYVLEIQDAINDGWLVPITARPIHIESIDLSGVRTTAGDLNGADLETQIDKNAVAIGSQLYPVAMGRKTLVFAPAVLSSMHIAEALNHEAALAGNPPCALHVDGKTPEDERARIFDSFKNNPDIDFLCNVGIATEGWDGPFVEVVAIARPTKSRALYAQMVGRGTRPLPGIVDGPPTAEERRAAIAASAKPSMEIIDFVGNSGRHKLVYATDILGGNYDRAVVDEAERAIRENTGRPLDVQEELERAKQRLEQQKIAAAEAARRRVIQAGARVVATVGKAVNVFDLLDVRAPWDTGQSYEMPASPAQTDLLIKFGIPSDEAYKMNKRTATRMIGKLIERRKNGLCTFKQARLLQKNGYSPDATFEEARRIIDELSKRWRSRPREAVL